MLVAAILEAVVALCLCAAARAATPTQTILTGGKVSYSGTASGDFTYTHSSPNDEDISDHVQGTFDESWLVSPYQDVRPAVYRNGLSWDPSSGASEHYTSYTDGKVRDDFTCSYGFSHAGGVGSVGIDRTGPPALTVKGFQGALVANPQGPCAEHGMHAGDLREPGLDLSAGTAATWSLPADPPTGDSITKSFDLSGTQRYRFHTTAKTTVKLECALCVTEIDFKQPDIPSGDMQDVPDTGTYDGNLIEIDVKIENRSIANLTVPATLQVKDGPTLAGDQLTAAAGSTTTVIYKDIDTQGWAWKDGAAQTKRTIEYLTPFGGGSRDLPVRPKPLILVHGLNSDAGTWSAYRGFATAQHPNWDTFAVGDGQVPGTMDTDGFGGRSIADNALTEAQYIQHVREKIDASHVDLVVHSMGGLISRQYIQANMPLSYDGKPVASHLVMLGTPNEGSPCADLASMLPGAGTPYMQLRPDWVKNVFDKSVTNQRGVPFSVVAGNPLSFTCLNDDDPGDGVVEVTSAWYQYLDHGLTDLAHTSMTGSETLFDQFVLPHVVGGGGTGSARAAVRAPARAAASSAGDADASVAVSRQLTLGGGATDQVPVAVSGADSALEFVFAAPATVAAALVDPAGTVVAQQVAGSPQAGMPIRTLRADHPAAGTWNLRVTQTGAAGASVSALAALAGDPLRLHAIASQSDAGGPVAVVADYTNAGAGVAGASVTAVVRGDDGSSTALQLFDDGQHGDGAAGDGRYAGSTAALPAGYHLAVVQAVDGGVTRIASASTTAGAANTPPPGGAGGSSGGDSSSGAVDSSGSRGGSSSSDAGPKVSPLRLTAGGGSAQSLRKGVVKVTCAASVSGTCSARVTVKIGRKRYRSRYATGHVAAGRRLTLALRFAAKDLRAIRRALRHHRLKAMIALTLRDETGRTTAATVPVRLKR